MTLIAFFQPYNTFLTWILITFFHTFTANNQLYVIQPCTLSNRLVSLSYLVAHDWGRLKKVTTDLVSPILFLIGTVVMKYRRMANWNVYGGFFVLEYGHGDHTILLPRSFRITYPQEYTHKYNSRVACLYNFLICLSFTNKRYSVLLRNSKLVRSGFTIPGLEQVTLTSETHTHIHSIKCTQKQSFNQSINISHTLSNFH